jgi:2-methylisocitrate lyase-like PEP mutase family enzyme
MFQKLGFVAAATTSTGFAWTTGRADYAGTREEVMEHLTSMCAAVDIPINADFESGFASEPEGVARNVGLALKTERMKAGSFEGLAAAMPGARLNDTFRGFN